MNPLRKIKAAAGCYPPHDGSAPEDNFYQYIYDLTHVISCLKRNNFCLVSKMSKRALPGLLKESKSAFAVLNRLFYYEGGNLLIKGFRRALAVLLDPVLSWFCGHVVLLVMRKRRQP